MTDTISKYMFQKQNIKIKTTKLFSSLFEDYISQSNSVKPFYNYHFSKQDFSEYLTKNTFDYLNRGVLVQSLNHQSKKGRLNFVIDMEIEQICYKTNNNCYS